MKNFREKGRKLSRMGPCRWLQTMSSSTAASTATSAVTTFATATMLALAAATVTPQQKTILPLLQQLPMALYVEKSPIFKGCIETW